MACLPEIQVDFTSRMGISGTVMAHEELEVVLYNTQNPNGGVDFSSPETYEISLFVNGSYLEDLVRMDSVRFKSNYKPVPKDEVYLMVSEEGREVMSTEVIQVPVNLEFKEITFVNRDAEGFDVLGFQVISNGEIGPLVIYKSFSKRSSFPTSSQYELFSSAICDRTEFGGEGMRTYELFCKEDTVDVAIHGVLSSPLRYWDSLNFILCSTNEFSSSFLSITELRTGDVPFTRVLFSSNENYPSNSSTNVGAVLGITCDTIKAY
jgi:hypothetical protein